VLSSLSEDARAIVSKLAGMAPNSNGWHAENVVSWQARPTMREGFVASGETRPKHGRAGPKVATPPTPQFLAQLADELAASDVLFFQHRYADAFVHATPNGPTSLAGYGHAYETIHRWIESGGDYTAELAADAKHAQLGACECLHQLQLFLPAGVSYAIAVLGNPVPLTLTADEIAYIWLRWSTLALDWGDALFRAADTTNNFLQGALDIYQSVVVVQNGTASAPAAGASPLYDIPSLQAPADQGRTIIQNLSALLQGQTTAQALGVNPAQAAVFLQIYQQLVKIQNGLDFWGHWRNSIPIWTFDYLQSAAINFSQLAINAERDYIDFQERSDQGSATRQQLTQMVSQAGAEVAAAKAQAAAAASEAQAYQMGAALAKQRAVDSLTNAIEYAQKSALAAGFQAVQVAASGGDSTDVETIQENADILQSQGYLFGTAKRAAGELAGAASLAASRVNRDYEVDSLKRTAQEMDAAAAQAGQEAAAAQARAAAANAATAVATLHGEAAQQNLQAFDAQTFTPDIWQRMADTMRRLYRRYLGMALNTARMMQAAYNFETDQSLSFIKSDYSTDEVRGLLAADALMADVQSFTYDLITSTTGKAQPIRQTLSLAQRYAFLFENQFRRTGVMEFETRIDDFDEVYPGTYAGRIESVEVEIIGLVPPSGISGTLTNSGISAYRTPTGAASADSGLKYRVQPRETLVLSDYSPRNDGILIPQDARQKRIFEGAGVVSTWKLEVPRAINDLDYSAIVDMRVTFSYKARYDPDLHDAVLAELASRPGVHERQRGLPLRWLYPDAFFRFQDTGVLSFSQSAMDFRSNETNPVITHIGLMVATAGLSPQGIVVGLSTPGKPTVTATSDASGMIDSSVDGNAWAALIGDTALGDFSVTVSAQDNPSLVTGGQLDLSKIVNLSLVLAYRFDPKA